MAEGNQEGAECLRGRRCVVNWQQEGGAEASKRNIVAGWLSPYY